MMADAAEQCPAYVLAGGQGERYGSDKARAKVGAQPLLLRLKDQLVASGRSVHVVADLPGRYDDLGISCLTDLQQQSGPLAGLATALEHRAATAGQGWLVLLACDLVYWDPSWLQSLRSRCNPANRVVVFSREHAETRKPQPFPGLFHTALLPRVLAALEDGNFSITALIQRQAWEDAGGASASQWSFNTLDEFQLAVTRLSNNSQAAQQHE